MRPLNHQTPICQISAQNLLTTVELNQQQLSGIQLLLQLLNLIHRNLVWFVIIQIFLGKD